MVPSTGFNHLWSLTPPTTADLDAWASQGMLPNRLWRIPREVLKTNSESFIDRRFVLRHDLARLIRVLDKIAALSKMVRNFVDLTVARGCTDELQDQLDVSLPTFSPKDVCLIADTCDKICMHGSGFTAC